jgi:hypothetical protein
MHDMYGHFRTKTHMKFTPGWYWKEAPTISIQQDIKHLSSIGLDVASHLPHLLCTGSVGGILLATRLYDEIGPTTVPFITILAAPVVATYDEASTDHGVILDDIWDESALAGFNPSLVPTDFNCPILAAW